MKTAPFFFLKAGLAALALAAAGEPAIHVTPLRLQLAQTIATPAARWSKSVVLSGTSKLLSSPDGGVVALVGYGDALLVRTSDGLPLSRITATIDDVFFVGDSVTIRSRGSAIDAFANASGKLLWHREGGPAVGRDTDFVFVSAPHRLTAYDLLTGNQRWRRETCDKVGIDNVLPNGVLVTSVYCGEPHQNIVT